MGYISGTDLDSRHAGRGCIGRAASVHVAWPQAPEDENSAGPATCTNRADLIERLKRGQSPTWVPHRHLESVWSQQEQPLTSPIRSPTYTNAGAGTAPLASMWSPPTITPEGDATTSDDERRLQDAMKIERPRSALHSGDFTQNETSLDAGASQLVAYTQTTEQSSGGGHSWMATSPPRDFTNLKFERRQPVLVRSHEVRSALSSLSYPVPTNFLYKPPTSPLFQSESNDEIDLSSPIDRIDLSSSPSLQYRRHTIMPSISGSYGPSQGLLQKQSASLRQERTLYQAHQPRRSLTVSSTYSTPGQSPQAPVTAHARRPSISSDVSSLQHASMVGSYEESILRGRMSTTPSKPLDFLAQIGVLGLGKCKSSLRCPPHVTLPFPAVFYSYASSSHGRFKGEDGPSPYVGQIDLERGLPNQEDDARLRRKHQSGDLERGAAEVVAMDTNHDKQNTPSRDSYKPQRTKRRSRSPRAPPEGSYRIPEKGQIQIIIKNPNKTAVKLFLVPYDLAGMEPGTKTFVRQRSYSNGPIIDNIPNLKDNSSADRPILRYLVHLHICCPSRGRFYLYKNIRVVFANRVPDGKEKLRNEITLPEPRFTPYKAVRAMYPQSSGGAGSGGSLVANASTRTRSPTVKLDTAHAFDMAKGFMSPGLLGHPFPHSFAQGHTAGESIPSEVSPNQTRALIGDKSTYDSDMSSWDGRGSQIDHYNKLNKGDVGYGGNAFSGLINGNPAVAESLLSQRLRSLGVPRQTPVGLEESSASKTPEE
ncbi:hypothetical protein F4861DRAFT_530852 [Xylaria intraflava]|nr:hypothetical protein F4861DRAFT_530852 [Xylaria intraflava]